MTYHNDFTLSNALLEQLTTSEQLTTQGLDALPNLFRVLLNAAMQIERQNHLGAAPNERTEARTGHANGYKDKTRATRIGQITVAVPQVREGGSYPQSLERGTRSERALKLALADLKLALAGMYVQGVSTRKVAAITEQLCGFSVSSGQVSQAARELDETLESWRSRPLAPQPYVYLDARYERVRQAGLVQKAAVLIAMGVDAAGRRSILGVSVALSEHEVHWRAFLQSLVARGLCGVRLVISDAHEGLKAARLSVLGGIPWQRCQFHLQQNASAHVPRQDMRAPVAADIRAVFNAQDRAEADALLRRAAQKYEQAAGGESRGGGGRRTRHPQSGRQREREVALEVTRWGLRLEDDPVLLGKRRLPISRGQGRLPHRRHPDVRAVARQRGEGAPRQGAAVGGDRHLERAADAGRPRPEVERLGGTGDGGAQRQDHLQRGQRRVAAGGVHPGVLVQQAAALAGEPHGHPHAHLLAGGQRDGRGRGAAPQQQQGLAAAGGAEAGDRHGPGVLVPEQEGLLGLGRGGGVKRTDLAGPLAPPGVSDLGGGDDGQLGRWECCVGPGSGSPCRRLPGDGRGGH